VVHIVESDSDDFFRFPIGLAACRETIYHFRLVYK